MLSATDVSADSSRRRFGFQQIVSYLAIKYEALAHFNSFFLLRLLAPRLGVALLRDDTVEVALTFAKIRKKATQLLCITVG